MLLFLSLSTADQTVWLLPRVSHGAVTRTRELVACVGGKAVNAARAARRIGGDCMLVGFFTPELASRLEAEGIAVDAVVPAKAVRRATSVVDLAAGEVSELVEEAHPPGSGELDAVTDRFLRRAADAAIVCLCGSLPQGVSPDFYRQIMERIGGKPVVVDAHGKTLGAVLAARPVLVKPNRAEVSALLGRPSPSLRDVVAQARELRRQGAENVGIGCGAEGMVLVGENVECMLVPPRVRAVNATGCGDAVTGVMAYGLAAGMGLEAAARLAVACGAASALDSVPAAFTPATARAFEASVVVSRSFA